MSRQEEEVEVGQDTPPELPPRPPNLLCLSPRPLPPHAPANRPHRQATPPEYQRPPSSERWYTPLTQKYVLLSLVCGSICVILGGLFLFIYLSVRATTTSLHYFQTIPTVVPAIAVSRAGPCCIVSI